MDTESKSNEINYYIINAPFPDWKVNFQNKYSGYKNFKYIENIHSINIDHKNIDYFILPVSYEQYVFYQNNEHCLFKNDLKNIMILHNKAMFAQFMMEHFMDNIPKTYYYNFDDITYIYTLNNDELLEQNKSIKLIQKPIIGCGGFYNKILNKFEKEKNIIVSEYIEHKQYFMGHFIVYKGKILNKVFFFTSNDNNNFIKRGPITNYKITKELDINIDIDIDNAIDDKIFENIFLKLNYSGYAASDFIISNNKIIIFEINPRPGGSLIECPEYFFAFMDSVLNIEKNVITN
jgi:predicted ATP-grasp superfamily ATP-dependent carboligase